MRRSDNPVIRMCRENFPRRRHYLKIFTVVLSGTALSAEILPGFFTECLEFFCLCGPFFRLCFEWFRWKIMLLFIDSNGTIASRFSNFTEHYKSPLFSDCAV